MDGAEEEPCGSHVGGAPPDVPDTVPMETALDCSALKALSPAQLQGYLLASPPLGGTNKREELDLADVVYMDGDGLSLPMPMVSPGGAVNCSILMSYLRKQEEPTDKAASPYKKPSPEPAPAGTAAAMPAEATRDLSQTCLVCGVAASGRGSRRLSDVDPLPASGGRLLPFVGRLLAEQLEAGALAQLRLVCLDCHDLLVTIDDLEQRVEAMRNSVRSQFRAWWLAEAVPAGGEQRRRSTRRAAGRLAAAGHDSVQTAGGPADDEYLPTKQRKHRTANSTGKARPGARSRTVTTSVESSKNLICSQCPFDTFDREALRGHIAAVHNGEKVHQCEVCQKRFTYEDSLKRHMNLHQHYIKEFRCEPCGEQFVKRADLLLHRQLYLHGAQASSPPPPPPAAANPADGDVGDFAIEFCCPSCAQSHTLRDDEKDLVVMCACGRQFDLAGALRLFPGRYRRSCLACRQDCADHNAMERHLTDSHGGGEVICLLCGCRYLRLDHFKLHALFHSTLRELACDTCEFRTFNPSHLASHSHPWSSEAGAANPGSQEAIVAAVRKHSVGRRGRPRKDTKPVPPDTMCPICNKELTSLTNLKNHMVLHSDVHAHTCTVCGRKFKLRKYLTTHLALHTGVRQFKCTLCEKEFNQKCELNRHMRYHNGEMKHVCEFCGKRFREANGLKFHRQVHTGERPFACGQCGIALRSAAKLRIHQRKHTGEKPYTCEYCGRDFAYKYNFDCHLRLHTGERRFRCSVCNSGFERRDKLHAHEQQCAKRTDAAPAAVPPPPQQPAPPSASPPLPSLPPHRHPSPPQPPHPPPQLHPPPPSLPAVAPIPAPPAPLSAAPPPTPPAPPTEPPQPYVWVMDALSSQ